MGFIISLNGADFVPYSSEHVPTPLVRKVRPAQEALEIDRDFDHPENFDDFLRATPAKKVSVYTETQDSANKAPKKVVYAKELMSSPVITLTKAATVSQALDLLEDHHIHHIPIVDVENGLVGIVSDRSLLAANKNVTLQEIMTKRVIAANLNIRIQEIARVMLENRIHSIPIVDDSKRLLGIITSTDIIRSVFKNPNVDLWA